MVFEKTKINQVCKLKTTSSKKTDPSPKNIILSTKNSLVKKQKKN